MKTTLFLATLLSFQIVFAAGTQPKNFHQVDAVVVRGAEPTKSNISWLQDLGVQTIVKLDDENQEEVSWGIPVEYLPINRFGLNLSYEMVTNILDRIESAKSKGLVYVHCQKGADRTGLIIALYRIKNGWSIDAARAEMNAPQFGHSSLQVWIDLKFEEYAARLAQDQTN